MSAGPGRSSGASSRGSGSWNGKSPDTDSTFVTKTDRTKAREREQRDKDDAESDSRYGFDHHMSVEPRTAFLFNVRAGTLTESGGGAVAGSSGSGGSSATHGSFSCLECFFVCEDGSTFKASIQHFPYFYLLLGASAASTSAYSSAAASASAAHSDYLEAESYLLRRYEGLLLSCQPVEVEDLSQLNHLSGLKRTYVKLSFRNVADLMSVRNSLLYVVQQNKKSIERRTAGALVGSASGGQQSGRELDSYQLKQRRKRDEVLDMLVDIREYDVPYITRVQIDLELRAGCWYDCALIPSFHPTAAMSLQAQQSSTTYTAHSLTPRPELLNPPLLKKLTFDIETTKQKLKFPNAAFDQVMMVSLMIDARGLLLINEEFVGGGVEDFDYVPAPDMPGSFEVEYYPNEERVLQRFFELIRHERPLIYITYNGDFFDWPFIDKRAAVYGLSLLDVGIANNEETYFGKQALHLDCFPWVKRDSYLPQGSQGLKAVAKVKLGYNPTEQDMETMMATARDEPHKLAAYSVSDAVATYYLYMKFVHFFIFSLSTIIPMSPSDVLRKGSGTLCESLLQVEARRGGIIAPNKQEEELDRWYAGRLVDSETYIGGHVECIESGVFRSDIPVHFRLNDERLRRLRSGVEKTMRFAVEKEYGRPVSECSNWDSVRADVESKLDALIAQPSLDCLPLIYHLDVGAMYPNIILTNRLQPMAVVDDSVCAACVWNVEGDKCQRRMEWKWKGKYYPATRSEVENIRRSLEYESNVAASSAAAASSSSPSAPYEAKSHYSSRYQRSGSSKASQGAVPAAAGYNELPAPAQSVLLKSKVKSYSHKVYSKYTVESTESRTAIVCQRENSFYVDTVRAFRDRRFVYKVKGKEAKRALEDAVHRHDTSGREQWSDTVLVYDSLQLAHKCILNSFYGYVMRRGARWHSIEMAGIVTNTGAELIKEATELVYDIGRPLELDTDGIWCMLPTSFPDSIRLEWAGGGSEKWSYPCSLLNESVAERYTNPQYQTLDAKPVPTDSSASSFLASDAAAPPSYTQSSECSILFEVDGPYRAMILPAAREEGKNIKKRYAVFGHDNAISELKGFEIKRRGELKLIKVLQEELFNDKKFLEGSTLEECYAAVGGVCNHWLSFLESKGVDHEEDFVIELISEQKSMSETVEDYGDRRSTSISTARRLAEFLGAEMLLDKGLNCKYIIAAKPEGAPTSERAIPTDIFQADEAVKKRYLRQWLKDPSVEDFSVQALVDWNYYTERLSAAIQKIVTIPAALQKVANPVERIKHPDWLGRRVRERDEAHKQMKMSKFFSASTPPDGSGVGGGGGDVMDIEDMLGSGDAAKKAAGKGRYTVVKRKMGTGGQRVTIELGDEDDDMGSDAAAQLLDKRARSAEEQKEGEADDMMVVDSAVAEERKEEEQDEFGSWLSTQKQHWKTLRERRKKSQRSAFLHPAAALTASTSAAASNPSINDGLHSYLRHSSASLTSSAWQIISVLPDAVPGYFRFHVLLHPATLTSVSVKADRVWLLNRRARMEADEALKRVERALPRGRKAHYLYEVRVDEREWKEREHQYLDGLAAGEVEGMYETQVPLLASIIRDVGCVCTVRPGARSLTSGGQPTFDAADLVYRTVAECGYLHSTSLYKGYLYESHSGGRGGLGVMCLFFEQSTEVLIVTVNAFGGEVDAVNVNKLYRDCYREMARAAKQATADGGAKADDEEDLLIPKHSFSLRHTTSTVDAYALIREQLHRYKQLSAHPTLLLTQVSTPLSLLHSHLPSLRTDFPVIAIPSHSADCAYPPFNWLQFALRHCLTRYLSCADWYNGMLELCRYAHVPIGCVGGEGGEVVSGLMDVVVARRLKEAKHVLWSSRGGGAEVEVGGRWVEEERALVGDDDDAGRTEVNNAGCYRSTCYELTLSRMCVNAILQSSEIEEESGSVERTDEQDVDDPTSTSLAPTTSLTASTSIARTFAIVKAYVTSLYHDCMRNSSLHADTFLLHFHRWLHSPASTLCDPLLARHIHSLMSRLYHSLLARLALLGSHIIAASFHRLVIDTRKTSRVQAQAYVDFILATLRKRPMYAHLGLHATRVWSGLLWMDSYNWSGLELMDDDSEQAYAVSIASGVSEEEQRLLGPSLVSCWHMSEYLPPLCQRGLRAVVERFLLQPYKHRLLHRHREAAMKEAGEWKDVGVEREECCSARLLELMRVLESGLYSLINEFNSPQLSEQQAAALAFPSLPGSPMRFSSPSLEFTKQVCAILSLDSVTADAARVLRENICKVLQVNAWSEAAQFRQPSRGVLVRDCVCAYCDEMRDVDLTRNNTGDQRVDDDELVEEEDDDGQIVTVRRAASPRSVYCESCHERYDRRLIEERLMRAVRCGLMRYQLQDLTCRVCGSMKEGYMNRRCECSGEYRGVKEGGGREERAREWRVLAAVCEEYGYVEAGEMVTFLLRMDGGADAQESIEADADEANAEAQEAAV